MYNRTAIMKSTWAQYRNMRGLRQSFDRKLFANVLRFQWAEVKRRVRYAAETEARRIAEIKRFKAMPLPAVAPKSELEERIDGLKYLSFRYDIGRIAQEMRAEHAHSVEAV